MKNTSPRRTHCSKVHPRIYDSGPLLHGRGPVVLRAELEDRVAVRLGHGISGPRHCTSEVEILNRVVHAHASTWSRFKYRSLLAHRAS
jgi:hypothetical protein